MMINILGMVANITSSILWLPQAKRTWESRNDKEKLQGISFGTQILVIINTLLWSIYGLMIHSIWLAMGIILILPLAVFTIVTKIKSENKEK